MNPPPAPAFDDRTLLDRVDEAHAAATELALLVSEWQKRMEVARIAMNDRGRSAQDVFREQVADGAAGERRELHQAMRRFERALHQLRALCVRSQVESGITVSEIARQTGVSVQMVRRLQAAGQSIADD